MNKNETGEKVRRYYFAKKEKKFPKNKIISLQKIVQTSNMCVRLENGTDPTVPPKTFTFDSVYEEAPTEAIYNEICYPLVEVSEVQRTI